MFLSLPRTVEADPLCERVSLSEGMQCEDARILLREICQLSCDSEKESLVLNALDYQPLAIACAAIYVRYVAAASQQHPSKN